MHYNLIRSNRKTLGVEIKDGQIIVRAPQKMSERHINTFLSEHEAWIKGKLAKSVEIKTEAEAAGYLSEEDIRKLRKAARAYIPQRVKHYADIMGVNYGRIAIRCQRMEWGSCSAKNNLNFNCLLMLAPPEVIDSVIVHELCHLKEMNHSELFYREVRKVYPDYDRNHSWLKKNGSVIMARVK